MTKKTNLFENILMERLKDYFLTDDVSFIDDKDIAVCKAVYANNEYKHIDRVFYKAVMIDCITDYTNQSIIGFTHNGYTIHVSRDTTKQPPIDAIIVNG